MPGDGAAELVRRYAAAAGLDPRDAAAAGRGGGSGPRAAVLTGATATGTRRDLSRGAATARALSSVMRGGRGAGAREAELRRLVAAGAVTGREAGALRRTLALRGKDHRRLPRGEVRLALARARAAHPAAALTAAERGALDRDGYLNLGRLLGDAQLAAIRRRLDAVTEAHGRGLAARGAAAEMRGIARVSSVAIRGAANADGLLDVFFTHPRLLAAVEHVLGGDLKLMSTNFAAPLPGWGHQGLHCDWLAGVAPGEYEICNSIWMLDDFTPSNGPTRVVPGSHRSGASPIERLGDLAAAHPDEVHLLGRAGTCVVFNSHLWHGGTLNRSAAPRRSLHSAFTRGRNAQQHEHGDAAFLSPAIYDRLGRAERAILDVVDPRTARVKGAAGQSEQEAAKQSRDPIYSAMPRL